jgi:8-oxo-dGTP pyrophosphatase MutT (NUDIX family)
MPTNSADILRRLAPRLSPALAARLESWATGTEPVPARRAASVILLREAPELETYLLRRHARMAFAASMAVFPGGGVDPADEATPDPWLACAVRETAEETGVRLAPDALAPWAEWTTPEFEPRRYETRFYVAALPPGQVAADLSGETESAGWSTPSAALALADRDELALMPPTRSMLMELAELGTLAAVAGAAVDRVIVPVLPRPVRGPDGWWFRYPERQES